jgi:hypothetical protein
MNLQLTGILLQELSKKVDKNGNDYYHGKLDCNDGSQYVFFFFQPDYDLSIRLEDLTENQELTLQGSWGKREPMAFIATNFYLEEETKSNDNFFV